MLTQATYRRLAEGVIRCLQNEGRTIVSDEIMDAMADIDSDFVTTVKTCRNRQQCGMKDQYVAWVFDSAAPVDLSPLDVL